MYSKTQNFKKIFFFVFDKNSIFYPNMKLVLTSQYFNLFNVHHFQEFCIIQSKTQKNKTFRRLRTILFYLKNFRFEKIDLKVQHLIS